MMLKYENQPIIQTDVGVSNEVAKASLNEELQTLTSTGLHHAVLPV
jgi:hypothetical protein